ncbi:hypothetical protein [Lactococcus lactis]|uniref:hypothetical protein n=1 Tax=Lactococcus lactis TaxID=1358 RepID=UPI001F52D5A3|nr:hypothetical protein [Lactococcus lactis]MCI1072193.1 hypothetical protein [Lactococcus lactis]
MYKHYLDNEQMNFQINRFLEPFYSNKTIQDDIRIICKSIIDLESWYTGWNKLANVQHEIKNFELASAYYQLAEFFLEESDPRKIKAYKFFRE